MEETGIADYKILARTVIVVAVKRIPGEWCAYIKDVPGENHEREIELVRKWGAKLREDLALFLFPQFRGTPYAW